LNRLALHDGYIGPSWEFFSLASVLLRFISIESQLNVGFIGWNEYKWTKKTKVKSQLAN
jgi:hypothetical protein